MKQKLSEKEQPLAKIPKRLAACIETKKKNPKEIT